MWFKSPLFVDEISQRAYNLHGAKTWFSDVFQVHLSQKAFKPYLFVPYESHVSISLLLKAIFTPVLMYGAKRQSSLHVAEQLRTCLDPLVVDFPAWLVPPGWSDIWPDMNPLGWNAFELGFSWGLPNHLSPAEMDLFLVIASTTASNSDGGDNQKRRNIIGAPSWQSKNLGMDQHLFYRVLTHTQVRDLP